MPYIFGSKSEVVLQERIFQYSTTWSPPFNCKAYVTVIGAGGAGASSLMNNSGTAYCAAGGGAGGCAKSLLNLSSSVTYTITIGAGGASVGTTNDGGDASGNSVFSGSDITTMTCTGGDGGETGVGAEVISTKNGGAGGTATGGNIWEVTGGVGGSSTCSFFIANGVHIAAGGGGAAGILGESFRGGNALNSVTGYDKISLAGGAGVGGRGGDATCTAKDNFGNGTQATAKARGGGGDGPGEDALMTDAAYGYRVGYYISNDDASLIKISNYEAQNKIATANTGIGGGSDAQFDAQNMRQGMTTSIFHGLHGGATGARQSGQVAFSGPGAGGSGRWMATDANVNNHSPGLFGGGGGASNNYYGTNYATSSCYGARGSFGAGGGGVAGKSNQTAYSGAGGDGLVVITILEIS